MDQFEDRAPCFRRSEDRPRSTGLPAYHLDTMQVSRYFHERFVGGGSRRSVLLVVKDQGTRR
jgi:hypothetical protein